MRTHRKAAEMRMCEGPVGAQKIHELQRLLIQDYIDWILHQDNKFVLRKYTHKGIQFFRTHNAVGTELPYSVWQAIISQVRHAVDKQIQKWSNKDTQWAEGDKMKIKAFKASEGKKMKALVREYEKDVKFWFHCKNFIVPMEPKICEEIISDYFLREAYKVVGSKILKDAGLSVGQRAMFVLATKFGCY